MKFWNRNLRRFLAGIAVLIFAAPLFGYVPRRSLVGGQVVINKWQAFPITWRMDPIRSSNITGSGDAISTFRTAFQTWSGVSTAAILFNEGQPAATSMKPGLDQVNLVSTNLTASEWGVYGLDAMSLTNVMSSTTTGRILEADIILNPNIGFNTDPVIQAGRTDLQAVATHEIGHLLGLDHSPLASAVMFPLTPGNSASRTLTADDTIGVSTLYPSAEFLARGSLEGTVRTTANLAVFGAIVVAVGQNGQPVAATVTDPDGKYSIAGLPAGSYTLLAEPMDGPFGENNFLTPLSILYPSKTVNINFTTRFH